MDFFPNDELVISGTSPELPRLGGLLFQVREDLQSLARMVAVAASRGSDAIETSSISSWENS